MISLALTVTWSDEKKEQPKKEKKAQKKQPDPFVFNTPKNWRSERIPFPLSFAPTIKHKGFEELRFAPGMFKLKDETYFTYVFLMWLEGKPKINAATLKDDLTKYYKGLCKVVAESRKLKLDLSKISLDVYLIRKRVKRFNHSVAAFQAEIDWYDPFVTGKPLRLYFEIEVWECDKTNHYAIFACTSPKDRDHKLWKQLRKIMSDFHCHKEIPKKAKDGPKKAKDGPKKAKDGPKKAKDGPKKGK